MGAATRSGKQDPECQQYDHHSPTNTSISSSEENSDGEGGSRNEIQTCTPNSDISSHSSEDGTPADQAREEINSRHAPTDEEVSGRPLASRGMPEAFMAASDNARNSPTDIEDITTNQTAHAHGSELVRKNGQDNITFAPSIDAVNGYSTEPSPLINMAYTSRHLDTCFNHNSMNHSSYYRSSHLTLPYGHSAAEQADLQTDNLSGVSDSAGLDSEAANLSGINFIQQQTQPQDPEDQPQSNPPPQLQQDDPQRQKGSKQSNKRGWPESIDENEVLLKRHKAGWSVESPSTWGSPSTNGGQSVGSLSTRDDQSACGSDHSLGSSPTHNQSTGSLENTSTQPNEHDQSGPLQLPL